MHNTYIEKERKKPFFEGYKPSYYFKNIIGEKEKEISKSIGINLFNKKEGD